MPSDKQNELHRFDKLLIEAYRDFLEYEQTQIGPKPSPAVRAARFNEYVNQNYPILKATVSPDICEAYMNRYKYLTAPLDQGPDDTLSPQQRVVEARKAYEDFRYDTGFSGSKEAEMLAFQNYVSVKYPRTLPGFSEEEAIDAINGWKAKRSRNYTLLGMVCAAALAVVTSPVWLGEAEPNFSPQPSNRRDRDKPLPPVPKPIFPAMDNPQWQPAIGPLPDDRHPFFQPPPNGWNPPPEWNLPPNWQDRLKQNDDKKGKDGEPPAPKR